MSDLTPAEGRITALLRAVQSGEPDALDELLPLVYEELLSLARGQRRRWRGDLTLNATAIVSEAYIKLFGQHGATLESRTHFFAVASKAMRHILCNHARDRHRQKRGGGAEHISIDEAPSALPIELSDEQATELSALDDALKKLEQINPRQSRIVECRFFGGLGVSDTASALGLSPATVKREWTKARAWLYREIRSA